MSVKTVPGFNLVDDSENANQALEEERAKRSPDPRICICGHNARSHGSQAVKGSESHKLFELRGIESCAPGRQECPCVGFREVAKCDNVRLFIFKTNGSYAKHALYKGIQQALAKGVDITQTGEWNCDACLGGAAEGKSVGPVPVNDLRQETDGPAPHTLLLCSECLSALRRGTLFAS